MKVTWEPMKQEVNQMFDSSTPKSILESSMSQHHYKNGKHNEITSYD